MQSLLGNCNEVSAELNEAWDAARRVEESTRMNKSVNSGPALRGKQIFSNRISSWRLICCSSSSLCFYFIHEGKLTHFNKGSFEVGVDEKG